MNIDFELILVSLTVICGILWLVDRLLFEKARKLAFAEKYQLVLEGKPSGVERTPDKNEFQSDKASSKGDVAVYRDPVLVEYAKSFFPVLLVVLILRSFIFEPFRIPSGSMLPTLLIGDFIVVNKFSYGVRLPVSHTKILDTGAPELGDVAVFRFPEEPDVDYIKRIVGLPGDTLLYQNKQLFVNGEPISLTHPKTYQPESGNLRTGAILELTETFHNKKHNILVNPLFDLRSGFAVNQPFVVPEGQYFVMGDNRDNSNDSRAWGTVPEENLVGKAVRIWMNLDFKWGRIGRRIE